MVRISCRTYNHAPYIEEAMNGFTMQETIFPFVCTIIDDASTDGEQKVITQYIESHFNLDDAAITRLETTNDYKMVFAQHKTNRNCFFAVFFLKYNHYSIKKPKMPYISEFTNSSKYIASCEGDDYWIDPHKLQKQVDFLENHPDYGLCFTDFELVEGHRTHYDLSRDNGIYFPEIITNGFNLVATLTVLYRRSVYETLPLHFWGKGWPLGDLPLWIEFAHETKMKYLPDITAKYRILQESASHKRDINKEIAYYQATDDVRVFYSKLYHVDYTPNLSLSYLVIMKCAFRHHDTTVAEEYYHLAKSKGVMTPKIRLFYYGTKYCIVRKTISFLFLLIEKIHLLKLKMK